MSGPAAATFERLVALETNACVIWPHMTSGRGYGRLRVGRRMMSVHVLALTRRVGPRPEGCEAAHLPVVCHEPRCMNYRHLRWASRLDNKADMLLDGTRRSGEAHGRARLTVEAVRAIRERHALGETATALAVEFGVGRTTVGHLLARRTWRRT